MSQYFQGQVTSEQQFQFIPRQPTEPQQGPTRGQPQPPTRFTNAGVTNPSVRPSVLSDNVPTVPAVTSFERFRPSEATDIENNFRFNPSPRPQPQPRPQFQPQQPPVFQEEPSFPPRLPVEQPRSLPQFTNSQTSVRTPTFTQPPAISIEPISGQGIINRGQPNLVASESETTGTAFRGRQRVRVRPEQVDTGVNRGRVRTKIRFDDANEDAVNVETETIAPPTTAGRGRTRSRFSGTRSRAPTSSRVVVTGTRKRQRIRDNVNDNINTEDIDNNLPEENRSPDIGSLSVRRKVNRIPNFTSRRKPANPTEIPVTRIPPRRRLRPFTIDDDQETVGFETESPEIVLENIEAEDQDEGGISVLPVSTVRFTF